MSETIIGDIIIKSNEELEKLQKEYILSLKGKKGNSEDFKRFIQNKKED